MQTHSAALIVTVGFVAAAIPFFLTTMPPVIDLPNHLARIWLLAGGAAVAPLNGMYQVDWTQSATNVALDAFGALLARLTSLAVASRVLLMMAFLGPPLGAVLLNRALFGGFHVWQLSLVALAWTTTAVAGFLSYQVSLAAALLLATAVVRYPPRRAVQALGRHLAGCTLLLLIHPFGVIFYLAIVAGILLEAEATPLAYPALIRSRFRDFALLAAGGILPVIALLALAPVAPGAHGSRHAGIVWGGLAHQGLWAKIAKVIDHFRTMLLSPVLTYDLIADLLLAAPLVALTIWAAVTGRLRVHRGLLAIVVVLVIASFLMPRSAGDAGWMQRRLPLMWALAGLAAVRPVIGTPQLRGIVAAVLIVGTALRIGWIGTVWHERQQDVAAWDGVTAHIAAGSPVIVLQQAPSDWHDAPVGRFVIGGPAPNATERHWGGMLVPRNHAFIPTLFTIPGQQPLKVRRAWKCKSVPSSAIPTVGGLGVRDARDPYLFGWRQNFDYVVVVDADLRGVETLPRDGLESIAAQGPIHLYRVMASQRAERSTACATPAM